MMRNTKKINLFPGIQGDRWSMSLQPKLSLSKKRWILPLKSMQLTWLRTVRPWLMSSCKILIALFQAGQRTTPFPLSTSPVVENVVGKPRWISLSTRTLFLRNLCLHLARVDSDGAAAITARSFGEKKVAPLLNSWSKRWRMQMIIKKY